MPKSKAAVLLASCLAVAPASASGEGMTLSARVDIDSKAPTIAYDPMIFGGFIEHFHRQVYGGIFEPDSPLSDENGFRTDVIEALRELEMPVVRWPGGCFASAYHWQDGVGPERSPAFDKAWKVEDPNTFGTDEFVLWSRAIGAEPYIATNAGTGTLEEMSDWVEYTNQTVGKWAALRKRNGFPEPHNVKFWSIGNENWGLHEPVTRSKEEWPMLVREAAQLMHAVDPTIRIFAPVLDNEEWLLPTLRAAGSKLRYVSIHGYWDALWGKPDTSDYMTCMSRAEKPEEQISRVSALLDKHGYDHIRIAFDEWNLRSWHHPNAPDGLASPEDIAARDVHDRNSDYTMADAVFAAGFFNACLRHADRVGMANISPIVNARGPLFVHPEGIVKRTTFRVIKMYTNELGTHVAKAVIDSPALEGVASGVAAVDAVATTDSERSEWRLAIVNRDPVKRARVRVAIDGSQLQGAYPATVLSGDDAESFNDIERPDRVVPESVSLSVSRGMVELPPHSITIVAH